MRLATALLLLFYSTYVHAQTIESLQTDEQVLRFMQEVYSYKVQFSSQPTKPAFYPYYDSVGRRKYPTPLYAKADFDNNGLTDLLFNGYLDTSPDSKSNACYRSSWVILAFDNDSFSVKELSYYEHHSLFFAARPVVAGGQPLLETMFYKYEYNRKRSKLLLRQQKDTLVYAFGDFIEKGRHTTDSIEQIRFCYSPGMSFSSPFTLTLSRDSATWEKEYELSSGLDMLPGSLAVAPLDPAVSNTLFGLLAALDLQHLQPQYQATWTCSSTAYLQVVYSNGTIKKIEDYGMLGTKGLSILYDAFLQLRDRLSWTVVQKASEANHFVNCH